MTYAKNQSNLDGQWVSRSAVGSFIAQVAISTVGTGILSTVVVMLAAVAIASVTKNNSGGDFIDHVVEQRVSVLGGGPYFIGPILAAFTLGFVSRRFFRASSAAWVWVLPLIFLTVSIATWKTGGAQPYWRDIWNNYFGRHCGASECLYETFLTAPLYTSVAYTAGWIFKGILQKHDAPGV